MMRRKNLYPFIIISLIFLFNPSVNILDVLPDAVAYALLIYAICAVDKTVPYFSECKDALVKLLIITLIKIPAFVVMRSNMAYGSDIVPLFTLSFAAIEIILIRIALKNLFSGLSYLGERTDCSSIRDSFNFSKKITVSPDSLYGITFGFFIIKAALNVIPELLLLSREDLALKNQLNDLYPTVIVLAVITALLIGCIWLKCALAYVKAIRARNDLSDAVKYIESSSGTQLSGTEAIQKRLFRSLTILAVSSLFTFDISFQGLGGYNVLPHFIYGIILFCAVYSLTENKKEHVWLATSVACFSVVAIIHQVFTARFFSSHQYVDLSYSKYARADYLPVMVSAVIETALLIVLAIVCAIILVRFIKEHTEVLPSDPSYSISNKKSHDRLIKMTIPLPLCAAVISILKCANVFIKTNVKVIHSDVNPDGIAASGAPFMNTVIFLICIIYVVYSFVIISNLKDEVRFKYGKKR